MPDPTPDISPANYSVRTDLVGSRPVLAVLAVLATTVVLLGCGLEGQPFGKDKEEGDDSSALVSEERIAGKDPGTPAATALTWWRGIQTRNLSAVKATYTPKVRRNLPKAFDSAVIAILAPTAAESSITTESFEKQTENRGTLLSTIDSSNVTMNGPLAQPMRKVRGDWLLSSSAFIKTLPGVIELGEALEAIESTSESSKETEPAKANEPSGG